VRSNRKDESETNVFKSTQNLSHSETPGDMKAFDAVPLTSRQEEDQILVPMLSEINL
jgi:hypothetical protein